MSKSAEPAASLGCGEEELVEEKSRLPMREAYSFFYPGLGEVVERESRLLLRIGRFVFFCESAILFFGPDSIHFQTLDWPEFSRSFIQR
jgi:hypothetical protein